MSLGHFKSLDQLEGLTSVMSKFGKAFSDKLETAGAQIDSLFKYLDEHVSVKDVEVASEVAYEDIINWFISQPRHPELEKGAILRRYYSADKIAIVQVFLNKSNDVIKEFDGKIYGRKLICCSIDQELAETFDGKNLIIVN